MSRMIDIRDVDVDEVITQIRYSDFTGPIELCDSNDTIYHGDVGGALVSIKEIDNLIKALQYAKEIWRLK
jgi:hypothetical protein